MNDHAAVAELVRRAEQDQMLRETLQNTKTPEDVVQAAAKAGVTVSVGEIRAFRHDLVASQHKSADGELSESELERVAGGYLPYFERMPSSWEGTVTPEKWRA